MASLENQMFANGKCIKKGTDQLFVIFVSRIVQLLFYFYSKFQVKLLALLSTRQVCVGPVQKLFFLCRSSYTCACICLPLLIYTTKASFDNIQMYMHQVKFINITIQICYCHFHTGQPHYNTYV